MTSKKVRLQLDSTKTLEALWVQTPQNKAQALILPGSGNVGVDGDITHPLMGSGHHGRPAKLNEQLAECLARCGVSSFRYAKRGFEDPSELPNQRLPYLLDDARLAYKEVQKKAKTNEKIILIGFSEGALLSTLLASEKAPDALFLLALPTRTIDETLKFQFIEWPIQWLQEKLKLGTRDVITAAQWKPFEKEGVYPFLGEALAPLKWQDFPKKEVSLSQDLIPAYQKVYEGVMQLLAQPPWDVWLESMRTLPAFQDIAQKIHCPVYIFHGKQDAQINVEWIQKDHHFFGKAPHLEIFPELGHSFAPMDGPMQSQRTSGPFDQILLNRIEKILTLF